MYIFIYVHTCAQDMEKMLEGVDVPAMLHAVEGAGIHGIPLPDYVSTSGRLGHSGKFLWPAHGNTPALEGLLLPTMGTFLFSLRWL